MSDRISVNDISPEPEHEKLVKDLVSGETYAVFFNARGNPDQGVSIKVQDVEGNNWMYVNSWINISSISSTYGPFVFTCRSDGPKRISITPVETGNMIVVDDIRITPATREMIVKGKKLKDKELHLEYDTYHFQVDKEKLKSFEGVHPRLFLSNERINFMKELIEKDISYRKLYEREKEVADNYLIRELPESEYIFTSFQNGQTRLNETIGHLLGSVSMMYVLTGERKYLDCAVKWLKLVVRDEFWEESPDLRTSLIMMGASVAYDWLYQDLDPDFRERFRKKLLHESNRLYEICIQPERWYWNRRFLQNHMWFGVNAMLSGSLAIFDEEPRALDIIGKAVDYLSASTSLLPPDGSAFEGVSYWFYGMHPYFMAVHLSRDLLNVDMTRVPYFMNTGEFLTYAFLPKSAWKNRDLYFEFYDSRIEYHIHIRDYLLWFLASEYKDNYMQWLGNEMSREREDQKGSWISLLWYNPDIKPIKPGDELPTLRHFDDFDIVFARSSWDDDAAALMFHCGPYLGNKAEDLYSGILGNADVGHVHPECNHFILSGNMGELLFIDDDYAMPKLTSNHNTLIVNGVGQKGEGEDWFRYKDKLQDRPYIRKVESSPSLDYMVGDATPVYRDETGVEKYVRHLLFLKPDILIVVDDIQLSEPGNMELRFWPNTKEISNNQKNEYLMSGIHNKVRMITLTPKDVKVEIQKEQVRVRSWSPKNNFQEKTVMRIMKQGDKWRNAFAISWSDKLSSPRLINFTEKDGKWRFEVEGKTIELNLDTFNAKEM